MAAETNRRRLAVRMITVAALVGALMGVARVSLAADLPGRTVNVTADGAYAFEGWGTSLAWWAEVVGGWSDPQRLAIERELFGAPDLGNPADDALGLNVVRYNVGAGSLPGDPVRQQCHVSFRDGGDVPTPKAETGEPVDVSRDARQYRVFLTADSVLHEPGQPLPHYEAFANSPPWWDTQSQCSQGNGADVFKDFPFDPGLAQVRYDMYVDYLMGVLTDFNQRGIQFDTVEPFNEPDTPWPNFCATNCQEGAEVQSDSQAAVIARLCAALRGTPNLPTRISAPDGNSPDLTVAALDLYDMSPAVRDCVRGVNTHSYQNGSEPYLGTSGGDQRAAIADRVRPPRRLWMSEFGNRGTGADIDSGLRLSTEIARDLQFMRPRAWVYWQAVEAASSNNWGLFEAPAWPTESPTTPKTKRYFALAQYSRYIRPNYLILSTRDPQAADHHQLSVAAVDPGLHRIVLVTTNCGPADNNPPDDPPPDCGDRSVTYNLNALGVTTGHVSKVRTLAGAEMDLIPAGSTDMVGGTFTDDTQPANSITTYVVDSDQAVILPAGVTPPPIVDAGPDVFGDEGTPIQLHGSVRGGATAHWSMHPGPGVDPGATCTFANPVDPATAVTCTDEGTYIATLTADDGINPPVGANTRVHVHNLGPAISVSAPQPWQLFRLGAPVDLIAPIVDPGPHDTHTCTTDWDDQTTQTYTGTDRCAHSHTFAHAGMYTIRTTVTDDDGVSATSQVLVIVYDPSAGTVAGNGWITAPGQDGFTLSGSYPSPTATTPQGAVTFAAPGLYLRTDQHIEWVVVTPDGKIAIKGVGELVPGKKVGFVVYGYQGCIAQQTTGCQPGGNRLRMLIWDAAASPIPDGVPAIYDNRPGASFDLDQADPQPLAAGIILIQ